MAFALTNKVYATPDDTFQPKCHFELADQTAASTKDTTIAGLKWFRVRILVKSGLTNAQAVLFSVRVGTGSGLTSPELVAVSPTYTFVTGDTNLCWDYVGYSQTGFQSFSVTPTNTGGTASYDVMFDAA